jgi:hypothetical protein
MEMRLDGSGRVACGGGTNLMLQLRLERGDDKIKHYRKMNWRQRAHLGSMGRKRDMVRRRDDVGRRRGGTEKDKGRRRRQLGSRESYSAEK